MENSPAAQIEFDCPGCGRRLCIAPEYAGTEAKCPSCGEQQMVPPAAGEPLPSMSDLPVVEYAGPATAAADRARRAAPADKSDSVLAANRVRIDPTDPFVGNRFKNLYFPLIIIVGSALFSLAAEVIFHSSHMFIEFPDPKAGLITGSKLVAMDLVIELPAMLIASLLAVQLLDAAFGPLWPALLKLYSIALVTKGVLFAGVTVGWSIGFLIGNEYYAGWSYNLGALIGGLLGLMAYFRLFVYYFDMDSGEAWHMILLIWFTQTVLGWMSLAALHSFFGRR
jgi:predicted RNA-binding Zn-ribbon protein involved in translation (DUF1610 family)